ncbi:MAG: metallophosphoesterase, partial [Actinomycetota bacterium]
MPVLPPGSEPVRVLQVSDLHLRTSNRTMVGFLESLAGDSYDVVLATGDLLGAPASVDETLRLLNALTGTELRGFVFGSSDYWAPVLKNYLDYFLNRRRHGTTRNPTEYFRSGLTSTGWLDLNNTDQIVQARGRSVQLTGLDDPYLHREDRNLLVRDPQAAVAIVVVHDPAPYDDALDAGYDLVISGHTHGGQVRMPLKGAVVTNSTLPPDLARGLSRVGRGWLFVSPGLGTGKYAPFRFLCPPEVSILNLVA